MHTHTQTMPFVTTEITVSLMVAGNITLSERETET